MTPLPYDLDVSEPQMSLTAIGFWLLYISGVSAALVTPLAGVLLYILVYHMNPEYQWWGASIRAAGLRTSLTIVIAIAIGLALRRPRFIGAGRQFPLPIVWAIALVILAVASQTWGYGASVRGAYQAEKLVKVMIFVLIMIRCVREPHHYHLMIAVWLCGIFYIGYQAWGHVGLYRGGRLSLGVGGPDFSDSGDLAAHLVASLPLIGAMFFMARRWWSRALLLITGALAVNTIVLTRTRNVVFALIAMCMAGVFSLPRGYRLKGLAAVVVGGFLAVQLTDPGWWERMTTIFEYADDASAMDRLTFWHAAVDMAGDHPLGIGIGNFQEVVKEYVPGLQIVRGAHSTYFECLAELGYPGVILLTAVLVTTMRRLGRIRKEAARGEPSLPIDIGGYQTQFHLGWHAMALRTALVGYLTSAMFTTRLCAEDFWILIGLAACLDNVRASLQHQTQRASQRNAVAVGQPVAGESL